MKQVQRFLIAGKRAAEYRFMNEVDAELEGVVAGRVADVVTELILLLIAQVGEQGDGRGELIVAEGLESGNRLRCGTERERQREAEGRIARLGEVQLAGVEYECAEPGWTKRIRVADDRVPVIVVRGQSGRGQRGLLYQGVVREVLVFRCAKKPE